MAVILVATSACCLVICVCFGARSAATSCVTSPLTSRPEPMPVDCSVGKVVLRSSHEVDQRHRVLFQGARHSQHRFPGNLPDQITGARIAHADHHLAAAFVDTKLEL